MRAISHPMWLGVYWLNFGIRNFFRAPLGWLKVGIVMQLFFLGLQGFGVIGVILSIVFQPIFFIIAFSAAWQVQIQKNVHIIALWPLIKMRFKAFCMIGLVQLVLSLGFVFILQFLLADVLLWSETPKLEITSNIGSMLLKLAFGLLILFITHLFLQIFIVFSSVFLTGNEDTFQRMKKYCYIQALFYSFIALKRNILPFLLLIVLFLCLFILPLPFFLLISSIFLQNDLILVHLFYSSCFFYCAFPIFISSLFAAFHDIFLVNNDKIVSSGSLVKESQQASFFLLSLMIAKPLGQLQWLPVPNGLFLPKPIDHGKKIGCSHVHHDNNFQDITQLKSASQQFSKWSKEGSSPKQG